MQLGEMEGLIESLAVPTEFPVKLVEVAFPTLALLMRLTFEAC